MLPYAQLRARLVTVKEAWRAASFYIPTAKQIRSMPAPVLRACKDPTAEMCEACARFPCNKLMTQQFRAQGRVRSSDGFPLLFLSFSGVALAFALLNLERIPISGRWRVTLVPSLLSEQMDREYDESIVRSIASATLPHSSEAFKRVSRVGERLREANDIPEMEYFVIDDDTEENAFVSAGGKVLVYTGLLNLLETDDQLAMVLAHEMAHFVAGHSTERTAAEWIRYTVDSLTSSSETSTVHKVATMLVNLPQSRYMEREADHIGLILMARACFDLEAALQTWRILHDRKVAYLRIHDPAQLEADRIVHEATSSFLEDSVEAHSWQDMLMATHPSHQERISLFSLDGPWMHEALVEQDKRCKVCAPEHKAVGRKLHPEPWWEVAFVSERSSNT